MLSSQSRCFSTPVQPVSVSVKCPRVPGVPKAPGLSCLHHSHHAAIGKGSMRDIRSDLEERAKLVEREAADVLAYFDKKLEELKREHAARIGRLKAEFAALSVLTESEQRRIQNEPQPIEPGQQTPKVSSYSTSTTAFVCCGNLPQPRGRLEQTTSYEQRLSELESAVAASKQPGHSSVQHEHQRQQERQRQLLKAT